MTNDDARESDPWTGYAWSKDKPTTQGFYLYRDASGQCLMQVGRYKDLQQGMPDTLYAYPQVAGRSKSVEFDTVERSDGEWLNVTHVYGTPAIQGWIPVEAGLPEKGIAVLGFRSGDSHFGCEYGIAWREIDDESQPGLRWNESGRPTHWMRLPAPPRDEAPYSVMLWVTDADREKIIDGLSGQHALTDEEREAIELAAGDYRYHQDAGGRAQHIRQTLLGLLKRLK
jgi:hypothetical protein